MSHFISQVLIKNGGMTLVSSNHIAFIEELKSNYCWIG